MTNKIHEIKQRLEALPFPEKPWRYDPERPMFLGTTNAIEMYDRTLDLGRNMKEYYINEFGNYTLTTKAKKNMEDIKALGLFLENVREDIKYLLELVETHTKLF